MERRDITKCNVCADRESDSGNNRTSRHLYDGKAFRVLQILPQMMTVFSCNQMFTSLYRFKFRCAVSCNNKIINWL